MTCWSEVTAQTRMRPHQPRSSETVCSQQKLLPQLKLQVVASMNVLGLSRLMSSIVRSHF